MNKEEIEQKLNEILDTEKELIEDLVDGKLSYSISISILQNITKQAYNLGVEISAEVVKTKQEEKFIFSDDNYQIINVIDKQSILNLKL